MKEGGSEGSEVNGGSNRWMGNEGMMSGGRGGGIRGKVYAPSEFYTFPSTHQLCLFVFSLTISLYIHTFLLFQFPPTGIV